MIYINQSNHPVNLVDKESKSSFLTAFIPFCDFGGDPSTVGVKANNGVYLCNSFQAKILNNQLCYEVDLNRFSERHNKHHNEFHFGFGFVFTHNEDRQLTHDNVKVNNQQALRTRSCVLRIFSHS